MATVDWGSLGGAAAGAIVAGASVALAFSLAVRGLTRASELRDEGRGLAAGAWGTVGAAGLVVSLGVPLAGLLIVATDGPLL